MQATQPTQAELLRARQSIRNAIVFLRGGNTEPFHLIEPSLSFESGALYAIDWMLGLADGDLFWDHLRFLERIKSQLIAGEE